MNVLVLNFPGAEPKNLFGDERLENLHRLMDMGCFGVLNGSSEWNLLARQENHTLNLMEFFQQAGRKCAGYHDFASLINRLDPNASKILVVLAGAMAGFLFFNLPWPLRGRHRTFMGDAGSMVLGLAVAWFAVSLTQRQEGAAVPAPVMLWVLGIVLMDVFTVTVRRLARRRSPMAPDRDHTFTMCCCAAASDPGRPC